MATRILNFNDGFTSSSAPSGVGVGTTSFAVYASDAAFVTAKGSAAAEGDVYENSTDHCIHYYNGTAWINVGTPVFYGTMASPTLVPGGASLPVGSDFKQRRIIKGSGGAVDLSSVNPQIAAHTIDGAELLLIGGDDGATVTLADGNGVKMNGSLTLAQWWAIKFVWVNASSIWLCVGRETR